MPAIYIATRRQSEPERKLIMNPLTGKTALVTGASRGTGRASALALALAGAQVLVHCGEDDKAANEVVGIIQAAGGHAQKIAADLRAADGPHQLARRVRMIIGARLDVLVASAGIASDATIENTSIADFDDLFGLNVRAPYFLVQQLMPVMCKGSSVVLVSSRAAHATAGQLSAYAATSGAIDAMVRHFALTLGARGARVNAIASGEVATGMPALATTQFRREAAPAVQAFKRVAQPDDIGAGVTFLASDSARWITGQTLRIDGRTEF
jgi:3-oxoacyl-[acyl-carrier protein] reductase